MKTKRLISMLLSICLILSLVLSVSVETFAATEIKSVTLKGSIMPTVGGSMKFAFVPSNSNYTVIQIWREVETERLFSDSEEYNKMISEEIFLPEKDRKFVSGKDYIYLVGCILNSETTATFASDFKVIMDDGFDNFKEIEDAVGGKVFSLVFRPDNGSSHTHVNAAAIQNDDVYHWIKCHNSDCEHIFSSTKKKHYVDQTTGICEECGHKVEKITAITKEPTDESNKICGDTVQFSVQADGVGLEYVWYAKDGSVFYDTDNFWRTGAKVTVGRTDTLKIENFNMAMAEKFFPIKCKVVGIRGTVETKTVNVDTVTHNKNMITPIDETGHKIQCTCGHTIIEVENHTYDADDVCTVCSYKKGSTKTKFKSATLDLPDFDTEHTVADAKATATLKGVGTDGNGIENIKFYKTNASNALADDNFEFKDYRRSYTLRIYPKLSGSFYMDDSSTNIDLNAVYISFMGKSNRCIPQKDEDGKFYLEIKWVYVKGVYKMIFESGGGTGEQAEIKADEHNAIQFPECNFTKEGDEFVAWRYKDKLYSPGKDTDVYIDEENSYATAVWKSQLIKDVEIKMDTITDKQKVSDVKISAPIYSKGYNVSSVSWYEDNPVIGGLGAPLANDSVIRKNKDYNVKIVIYGSGFAAADDLNVSLNGNKSIFERNNVQNITVILSIKGGVEVTVDEPLDGEYLASADSMIVNKTDLFEIDKTKTFWTGINYSKYWLADDTQAQNGINYYLRCSIKNKDTASNVVLFGDILKINGEEYKIYQYSGDEISIYVPYMASVVKIKETTEGGIFIQSSKAMDVKYSMALYNKDNLLKELIWADISLEKGENNVVSKLGSSDLMKLMNKILNRSATDKVKIMILDNISTLTPLCDLHQYRYYGN